MTDIGDGSQARTDVVEDQVDVDQFMRIRKEAGLNIDPHTAEIFWGYYLTLDPYGIFPDLPEDWRQVGRTYFARSPDSKIWVEFGDLPDEVRDKIEDDIQAGKHDDDEDYCFVF